jgi:hypothetical protein
MAQGVRRYGPTSFACIPFCSDNRLRVGSGLWWRWSYSGADGQNNVTPGWCRESTVFGSADGNGRGSALLLDSHRYHCHAPWN